MNALRGKLPTLPGQRFGGLTVRSCDDFSYHDPVDLSVTPKQGVRILFEEDARAVFRLSGTGTSGATLRVYLERFEPDTARHNLPTADVLAPVVQAANEIAEIATRTERDERHHLTGAHGLRANQ
jgi:phosphoglucomutase